MATLVYCDADGASARYQLRGKEILIGSTDECAIRSGDPLVAPRHARLFERAGEYWIEDLGSTSGVFIGTKQVSEGRVPFGEVVLVGSVALRIDDESSSAQTNGALFDHGQLIAQLATVMDGRRKLEEERNALGQRVGQLHQELREARASTEVDDGDEAPHPDLSPAGPSLEKLAGELQKAEAARREIEKKIATAERRRAQTSSEVVAAEAESLADDSSEMEVRQVQILSLQAQLAEADKGVDRLRAQLANRNNQIAALRASARVQVVAPSMTKEYAAASDDDDDDDDRLAEIKARFEAEFERAATLQQKLKTAEQRLTDLEQTRGEGGKEMAALRQRAERASAAKAVLEGRVEALEREAATAAEGRGASSEDVAKLESQVEDLKKLLEGARREIGVFKTVANNHKAELEQAQGRASELESDIGDSASEIIARDERIAALEKRLVSVKDELADKDGELTEMAAAVAISAEVGDTRESLEKTIARLETELATVRNAVSRADSARDAAFAARRELESRVIAAESGFREGQAKLDHLARKAEQAKGAREKAEARLAAVKADLIEAREARLKAEDALNASGQKPDRVENTQVLSLRRRLSENQDEAELELERLEGRIRELEEDLDRALDAEQAALARIDIDQSAMQTRVDRLEAERDELSERVATLRDEVEASTLRADTAEARVAELESHLAENHVTVNRVSELESDLHKLRIQANRAKALDVSLQEARTVASEQARRMATLEEELAAAAAAGTATVDLRSRVVELASQNARMSSEISEMGEQHEATTSALREELDETRLQLRKLGTERASIQSAHVEMTRRYESVTSDLEATSNDLDTLRRQTAPGAPSVSGNAAALAAEVNALRNRVAELEVALSDDITSVGELGEETSTGVRVDTLADIHDLTTPGGASIAVSQWMTTLRAAVTDLRRSMRAASDEAAVMGGGRSVEVINNALSAAVERVETARDAIARLGSLLDC